MGRWFDYNDNHRPRWTVAGKTPAGAYRQIGISEQVEQAPPVLNTKLAAYHQAGELISAASPSENPDPLTCAYYEMGAPSLW